MTHLFGTETTPMWAIACHCTHSLSRFGYNVKLPNLFLNNKSGKSIQNRDEMKIQKRVKRKIAVRVSIRHPSLILRPVPQDRHSSLLLTYRKKHMLVGHVIC